MAAPRIFISSTCYDLQEIRFQLRRFIQDIGYEPVMSEFGDIFYDLGDHVQIPVQTCHPFRNKVATHSGGKFTTFRVISGIGFGEGVWENWTGA